MTTDHENAFYVNGSFSYIKFQTVEQSTTRGQTKCFKSKRFVISQCGFYGFLILLSMKMKHLSVMTTFKN
jgi:hypothetical protein